MWLMQANNRAKIYFLLMLCSIKGLIVDSYMTLYDGHHFIRQYQCPLTVPGLTECEGKGCNMGMTSTILIDIVIFFIFNYMVNKAIMQNNGLAFVVTEK